MVLFCCRKLKKKSGKADLATLILLYISSIETIIFQVLLNIRQKILISYPQSVSMLMLMCLTLFSFFFFNSLGESIAISSEFQNQSGRRIKPRATLYQRTTFFADGKSRSVRNAVASLQGTTIRGRRTETWSNKLLKIPPITPTLTNCGIIKLEYFLTVSVLYQLAHTVNI